MRMPLAFSFLLPPPCRSRSHSAMSASQLPRLYLGHQSWSFRGDMGRSCMQHTHGELTHIRSKIAKDVDTGVVSPSCELNRSLKATVALVIEFLRLRSTALCQRRYATHHLWVNGFIPVPHLPRENSETPTNTESTSPTRHALS